MGDRDLDGMDWDDGNGGHLVTGDVLGQFEVHRAGPLLHRDAKGVPHHGRNAGGTDDLPRQLRQRLHGRDHVHDLKARLPAAHDRLLAGDQDHRHRAEMRIGRARRQIERARSKSRQADAGLAGQPAMRGGHEGGSLLVTGQHQLDFGGAERFHEIEILLAGYAEDAIDALVLQRRDKQVRSFDLAFLFTHVASQCLCWLVRVRRQPAHGSGLQHGHKSQCIRHGADDCRSDPRRPAITGSSSCPTAQGRGKRGKRVGQPVCNLGRRPNRHRSPAGTALPSKPLTEHDI